MKVRVIPGRAMDDALAREWRHIQESNLDLSNPCFSPEFTLAMAMARTDVEIGILEEGSTTAAFFPFQRGRDGIGRPVGGMVSDFEGLICGPDFWCDPKQLIKDCALSVWDFDEVLASQTFFEAFHDDYYAAPVIDLSQGYEAYAREREAAGTQQLRKCEALLNRLERDLGPVRFTAHSTDQSALQTTLTWKSQQYRQSCWEDLFAQKWGRDLVECVLAQQGNTFAGMFSTLQAGDQLAAAHIGMRSGYVWHYWFPAYNPELCKYSPGLILLLLMAQQAPAMGLQRIDLGKGLSLYKRRFMNACTLLADGYVERPSWQTLKRAVRRKAKQALYGKISFPPEYRAVEGLRFLPSVSALPLRLKAGVHWGFKRAFERTRSE